MARSHRLENFAADGLFLDLVDQFLDHGQRDVRFQKCYPHFAERRVDILLLQRAAALEAVEDVSETICQTVEHRVSCVVLPVVPNAARTKGNGASARTLADWRSPSGLAACFFLKRQAACTADGRASQAPETRSNRHRNALIS